MTENDQNPGIELLRRIAEQQQVVVDQQRMMMDRLDSLERVASLKLEKKAYTTDEVAERVDRDGWTVRQWCNKGRVRARKVYGKGRTGEWRIDAAEVARVQADGPSSEGTFENERLIRAS